MKTYSIQPREVFAWIVFICAVVLFTCTIAFAQDAKTTESTIRIKIEKNENGKKTKIDTTVSKENLPQLKEYLKASGIDFDTEDNAFPFNHSFSKGSGAFSFHYDGEKLKKDMKKIRDDLSKMKEELKDIHIEINGDGDDASNFNFDMHIPSPPPAPGVVSPSPHAFWFDSDDDDEKKQKHHSYSYSYSFNDDVPDSLNDDAHIVIRGKEGEDKPEFEKEITGKHGEKIFIFKRNLPKENLEKPKTSLGISRVKVYPNPSNGKITLSFNSSSKSDVIISITDTNGKEVFSETKRDFSGQYSNQIDLGEKVKGAYFVKIIQGDDSITKKILVEPESK